MKSFCLFSALLPLCLGVTFALATEQPPLSLAQMQERLLKLEKELASKEGRLVKVERELSSKEKRLLQVEANPVPLGFLYTQYPKEKPPTAIWPSINWTDVTAAYAGVFFRASGGSSDTFGAIQEENVPTIDKVEGEGCVWDTKGKCHRYMDVNPKYSFTFSTSVSLANTTGWSDYVGSNQIWTSPLGDNSGHNTGDNSDHQFYQVIHRYHTTAGEVRPRNMAIKVWKRTA